MIWNGQEPLVIGVVGPAGVKEEIVVQPGEELPPRALELLRSPKLLQVEHGRIYTRARVRAALAWAKRAARGEPA